MAEETKHVLLRTDLEPAFDESAVLAEIDAMAEGGGAWEDHIPYLAARQFYERSEGSARYVSHVDECGYCQRLIDALNPTRKVLEELRGVLREVGSERPGIGAPVESWEAVAESEIEGGSARVSAGWWSSWQPVHVAAALLVGVATTWVVMNLGPMNRMSAYETMVGGEPNPSTWVSEGELAAQVLEAPGLFEAAQRPAAVTRVGAGYALVKVDGDMVALLSAESSASSTKSLEEELADLMGKESLTDVERLRMVQLLIQRGETEKATASLQAALERGGIVGWTEALERADLVTAVLRHQAAVDGGESGQKVGTRG